jgi:hypothetical protein
VRGFRQDPPQASRRISPTGFTRGDNRRGGRPRQHLEVTTRLAATAAAFVLFYPRGLAQIVFVLSNVNSKRRHKELG